MSRFRAEEAEIARSPMKRVRPPAVPEVPLPVLVDDEIRVEACAALDAAVAARQVRHGNQDELNAAVAAARRSSTGEAGQRVLSRKDPQVLALVAATLAPHAASIPPPSNGGSFVAI